MVPIDSESILLGRTRASAIPEPKPRRKLLANLTDKDGDWVLVTQSDEDGSIFIETFGMVKLSADDALTLTTNINTAIFPWQSSSRKSAGQAHV